MALGSELGAKGWELCLALQAAQPVATLQMPLWETQGPQHVNSQEPKGRKLCSALQAAQPAATLRMPLRETQEPQQVNDDDPVQPGHSILYYQPFNTTDLLNW